MADGQPCSPQHGSDFFSFILTTSSIAMLAKVRLFTNSRFSQQGGGEQQPGALPQGHCRCKFLAPATREHSGCFHDARVAEHTGSSWCEHTQTPMIPVHSRLLNSKLKVIHGELLHWDHGANNFMLLWFTKMLNNQQDCSGTVSFE